MKAGRGILLNPTGLLHTDMFLLSLLSGYVKKTGPKKAWESAVKALPVAGALKTVAPFFDLPYEKLPETALSARSLLRVKAALNKLIWEWKSPLQREWYPFLYSLKSDIELLERKPGRELREWIQKKYPPVLAEILNKG